jgi:hypothetical protein
LNFGRLEEVIEIRKQLRDACDESKLDLNVQNGKTVENLKSVFSKVSKLHHFLFLGRQLRTASI